MAAPPAKRSRPNDYRVLTPLTPEALSRHQPESQDWKYWSESEKHSTWEKATQDWQDLYKEDNKVFAHSEYFKFPSTSAPSTTFLVRSCFQSLYDEVLASAFGGDQVLITGHPGTGKTVSLFYLIVRTLSEHPDQPFLFVHRAVTFLFWKGVVYHQSTNECNWALPRPKDDRYLSLLTFVNWDLSLTNALPALFIDISPVVLIQVASPNFVWRTPHRIGLPRWTTNELQKGFFCDRRSQTFFLYLKQALSVNGEANVTLGIQKAIVSLSKAMESAKAEQTVKGVTVSISMDDPDAGPEEVQEPSTEKGREIEAPQEELDAELRAKLAAASLSDLAMMEEVELAAVLPVIAKAREWAGDCPREIYETIYSAWDLESDARSAVIENGGDTTLNNFVQAVRSFARNLSLDAISHRLVFVTPLVPDTDHEPSNDSVVCQPKWEFSFKTPAIENLVMEALATLSYQEQRCWFGIFEGIPVAGTLVGCFFKNLLPTLIENHSGPIPLYRMHPERGTTKFSTPKVLEQHKKFTLPAVSHIRRLFNLGKLGDILDNITEPTYIFSTQSNTPLFNGILVDPISNPPVLWIIQTSQIDPHKGAPTGYSFIMEIAHAITKTNQSRLVIRYVLAKPTRQNVEKRASWYMPDGWEQCKGAVFGA